MALANMGFSRKVAMTSPEILYHANFVGEAITLDTTAFTAGVCKAGSVIDKTGKLANTSSAYGIVLVDVYEERPIATAVVEGYIKTAVAQAHSGVTVAEAAKTAMPKVTFC